MLQICTVLLHRNDRGRSPEKGSSWSDRFKNVTRERSRSHSPVRAGPPQHTQVSFHKAMMERSGGDSDRNKSFNRERSPVNSFHKSIMGQGQPSNNGSQKNGGSHSYNGEVEEGMIPDEEGMIGQDDSIYQNVD